MAQKPKEKAEKIEGQHQRTPGREAAMKPKPQVIRNSYKGSEKLKGKVALITGADSGIGRSAAVHFAREGADVAVVYLSEDADARETEAMIKQEGQRCLLIKGDVGDKKFAEEAVQKVVQEFGKLNILVNNAGEQHPADSLEEIDFELTERTFRTNILGMFYITKPALKHLSEGDCIVNTTSVTSYRGSPHLLDYASTKGAITAFTRSLATNLADKNIRVNGVAPGPIWTPLIPSTFSEEHVESFGENVPLGRPGQPSECGPAYVFLASEDSSYITGQVIHINGGELVGA